MDERVRGTGAIPSSNRTYTLQYGVREASVSEIDETRGLICVLFAFSLLFDGLEEILTKVVFLFEQGNKLEAATGVAVGWDGYGRRRGLGFKAATVI